MYQSTTLSERHTWWGVEIDRLFVWLFYDVVSTVDSYQSRTRKNVSLLVAAQSIGFQSDSCRTRESWGNSAKTV
jgi:hypothetical protein